MTTALCLEVPTPGGGSEGSCDGAGGAPPELRAGVSETSSDQLVVYGTTTLANVDSIQLSLPLSVAAIPEANGGGTLFAGVVASNELPAELVVTDPASGQELGRIALDRGSLSGTASPTTTVAQVRELRVHHGSPEQGVDRDALGFGDQAFAGEAADHELPRGSLRHQRAHLARGRVDGAAGQQRPGPGEAEVLVTGQQLECTVDRLQSRCGIAADELLLGALAR